MKPLAAAILIAAWTCGCSNTPVRVESRAFPHQTYVSPERMIIAAVDNDSHPFLSRAGSTPRGYDSIKTYGATARARRVMRSLEGEYGLREVNAWPIEPLHMHCAVLEAPEGADRAALLVTLSHDQRIALAQPLQTFATSTEQYNDPYVGLQRGFQQMDVAGAHPWSQGEGVKVALIDTGVDVQHKDLQGSIAAAANFVDGDTEQFRRDRHGTEMAGVIAAIANNREGIVGVAPGARIQVYKACWQLRFDADAARCNSFTLARALVAAFDAHAQVINLSLAGPEDPLLRDLIREGLRRGIVFVGAAASETAERESLFHEPGIIEVATAGSHSVPASVLYAPGREILTLLPGGHYDFASGDSIATAQITGVVSLLLAKDHGLSAAATYTLLHNSSAHSGAAAGDSDYVDACAAVIALVGRGSCTPPTAAPIKPILESSALTK
jgi:Subtilase family